MRRFVKLTEENDWEGETWHFWLQLDGNQAELDKLAVWLEENSQEEGGFTLNLDKTRYEDEVDLLVEESDSGYLRTHNKVVGKADFGDLSLVDDPAEILCKGHVEDFFS
jgi:hypothetical protein